MKDKISITISFEEAQSLSHTICGSFVHDTEVLFLPYTDNASIEFVTQGKDENCSMHFCDSRLETIILREAFIAEGYKATTIFNEYADFKEDFIVLVNRPLSDYLSTKEK